MSTKSAAKKGAAAPAAPSGSVVVAALEAAYAAVRANHPDLPAVVFITGTGLMGRGAKWGHYWRDRWVDVASAKSGEDGAIVTAAGRHPEVFIAGERLACGAEDTFETILHEGAHALAVVRQIKDTSRDGRYHNARFLALATELGLEYAGEGPDTIIGYSNTRLAPETIERYAEVIAQLQAAITTYLDTFVGLDLSGSGGGDGKLPTPPKGGKDGKRSTNYVKAVCSCETPRTIRISARTLAEGPVACGLCGEAFTEA